MDPAPVYMGKNGSLCNEVGGDDDKKHTETRNGISRDRKHSSGNIPLYLKAGRDNREHKIDRVQTSYGDLPVPIGFSSGLRVMESSVALTELFTSAFYWNSLRQMIDSSEEVAMSRRRNFVISRYDKNEISMIGLISFSLLSHICRGCLHSTEFILRVVFVIARDYCAL